MNNIRFILSVAAFFLSITLFPTNTKLRTEQAGISTFRRDNDSVHIAFWVKQTEHINTLRELIIQPVISNSINTLPLTSYALRGSYNNKLHKRNSIFGYTVNHKKINSGSSVVVNTNPKKGTILYMDTVISYKPWMKDANLKLHLDLCGCGNEQRIIHDSKNLDYKPSPEEIHPFLVFSLSRADESITKNTQSYILYFRVNESIIDTNYLDNSNTLSRLRNDLKVLSQGVFNIAKATITGYASPEGPLSRNKKLAAARSLALTEESRRLNPDPKLKDPDIYLTDEDWSGLIAGLESDSSALAKNALGIIRNEKRREKQKTELRYSQNGKVYDFIKTKYLDKLRKSGLMLEFGLNQDRLIQSASLPEEMPRIIGYNSLFEYANNITDSVKRAQIIYNAAEIYSQNFTALLNAGIMALKERKIEKATTYLKSIEGENNPSELDNALGVLAIYTGKHEEARIYFQKAKEKGLSEVESNISILNSLN